MARATNYAAQWNRKGDLLSRAHDASLSFTTAMSFGIWLYPFSTDLVSFPVIMCKGNVNTAYLMLFESSTSKVTFRVRIGGVSKDVVDPNPVNRNAWNSYYGTYDGSNVRLFRGGSSTAIATTAATGNIDTNTNPLRFGDADTALANSWNGLMYDARLFNTARTGAEYAAEYNSEINPATSGLVTNWLMGEGINLVADDRTASALDLTVANSDQWSCMAGRPY
jgi:hypothetical protein